MLSAFLLFMSIGQYRTPRGRYFTEKFLGFARLQVPVTGTSQAGISCVILCLMDICLCWAHLPSVWDSELSCFHKLWLQKSEILTVIFSQDNGNSILYCSGLWYNVKMCWPLKVHMQNGSALPSERQNPHSHFLEMGWLLCVSRATFSLWLGVGVDGALRTES